MSTQDYVTILAISLTSAATFFTGYYFGKTLEVRRSVRFFTDLMTHVSDTYPKSEGMEPWEN